MHKGLPERENPFFTVKRASAPAAGYGHRKTTFAVRCARLLRLLWHFLKGLFIAWLRYPRLNERAQRATMRRWSRELLKLLSVKVRAGTTTRALPARRMIVSNHISWLDIFVLAARYPAIFVAKSEIRRWPFVGFLCHRAGTLFIERGRHSSAKRTNGVIAAAIRRGSLVTVFPEGTTTDGRTVAHFHAALFQPAIEADAWVQPVALRYVDAGGAYCDAPNYVGDTSLLQSLWHITSAREIHAKIDFLEPEPAGASNRKALAGQVRAAIQRHLSQDPGKRPGTDGGPPA